jgi:threonine/homoserine/homoserine lactone efflux protein
MDLSTWLIYAAVALVPILSPGPAVVLAISNSVAFGWRRAAYSSMGNVVGLFVLAVLAAAGLGTLLQTPSLLFAALKLLGAAYLIYLGIRQWRSKANGLIQPNTPTLKVRRSNRRLFTQGLLLATTNPKAILFFTALFPQFINTELALLTQFLILTGTFMLFSFFTLMGYALVACSARAWFSHPRNLRWFGRLSGGAFMLLGIGVLRLRHSTS